MQDDIDTMETFTRSEPRCLYYAMAVDDAASGQVTLVEKWEDEHTLKVHLHKPQVEALVLRLREVVSEIDLKMYDAVDERDVVNERDVPLAQ